MPEKSKVGSETVVPIGDIGLPHQFIAALRRLPKDVRKEAATCIMTGTGAKQTIGVLMEEQILEDICWKMREALNDEERDALTGALQNGRGNRIIMMLQ